MSPVALQPFNHQRVSGGRPMSDHVGLVSDLVNREIRKRRARLPVWSWIHLAGITFTTEIVFLETSCNSRNEAVLHSKDSSRIVPTTKVAAGQ